jgi:hypothetical protein
MDDTFLKVALQFSLFISIGMVIFWYTLAAAYAVLWSVIRTILGVAQYVVERMRFRPGVYRATPALTSTKYRRNVA